ncbi:nucleotidyltransferase domain-containing protein [Clostridium grantii]|uniref:Predicted nucleotidyltransferase n=1 Tax=Clostridium grantii DSM 8605 TaxID=1121316 RepID=A0A1M5WVB1_9CLOT|nr:nucleotidyltransferase domain-containing protein [Clostridium grantii]SHH90943.1 Predicted nucleotidyltransferase [Clostridium grantii DSM 8605]
MKFGLRQIDLQYIISTISNIDEIEKAIIFGSRAKGNYKQGSDIDIAIVGEKINFSVVARLHSMLEEFSPTPYFFDIVDFTHLEHKDLSEHIQRVGQIIYER